MDIFDKIQAKASESINNIKNLKDSSIDRAAEAISSYEEKSKLKKESALYKNEKKLEQREIKLEEFKKKLDVREKELDVREKELEPLKNRARNVFFLMLFFMIFGYFVLMNSDIDILRANHNLSSGAFKSHSNNSKDLYVNSRNDELQVTTTPKSCFNKGIAYYKEIGSHPYLKSTGQKTLDAVLERCGKSKYAFGSD